MANYTKEIRRMLEKVAISAISQDKEGFYSKSLNGTYSGLDIVLIQHIARGDTCIKDLVQNIGVSRNIVNTAVASLLNKKLIYKEKDETDGRLLLLRMTVKGRELFERIEEEQNKELEFMLNEATINEEKAILKFLSKYLQYRTEKYSAES